MGLAGGGTDVDPFCSTYGSFMINVTINKYAHCTVSDDVAETVYVATDLGIGDHTGDKLLLHKHTLDYVRKLVDDTSNRPLKISTYVDAPQGSGLGSSSCLVVAMISALAKYYGLNLFPEHIAKYAYDIERIICGYKGGWQDQYASAFGGFNVMEYKFGHYNVRPIEISHALYNNLEESLKIIYSNTSRDSANIIDDQAKHVIEKDPNVMLATEQVKTNAKRYYDCLVNDDYNGIIKCMRVAWTAKKNMSSKISNSCIEDIIDNAYMSGGLAAKISGAGGGGYIQFLVEPEHVCIFKNKMKGNGYIVEDVKFEKHGVRAWKVTE